MTTGFRNGRAGLPGEESGQELRGRPRFACSITSTELLVGEDETPVQAEVLDVSANGLRARVRSLIPTDSNVRLTLQKHVVSARVRFCRPDESGSFLLGLEILEFDESAG